MDNKQKNKFRRSTVVSLPLSGAVRIMVMSGAQRDEFMEVQLALRKEVMLSLADGDVAFDAMPPEEQKEKLKGAVTSDETLAAKFNQLNYQLIAWCVVDDEGVPMWNDAAEAGSSVDYEIATELAEACSKVNKLTKESKNEAQADFFEALKEDSGSPSPEVSDVQT